MDLDRLTCLLLGIPETNDHRRILGVPKDRNDHMAFDTALRRRIAQLYAHPSGRTKEAKSVRDYLQRISNDLKLSTRVKVGEDTGPEIELTPLDQSIIAVLIGEGGWNRQSRSRLVAVAASYQITVGGLMRILQAFAEASRSGAGPLSRKSLQTNRASREWTQLPTSKKSAMSAVDNFLAQTAKKITPELSSPSPVMTIKIAVLFGLLTLLAFILSLSVLLSPDEESPAIIDEISSDRNSNLLDHIISEPSEIHLVGFDTYPTFSISTFNSEQIDNADQLIPLIKQLQNTSTEMRAELLRGNTPKSIWTESWQHLIDVASIGWTQLDQQTTDYVHSSIASFIVSSERDPVLMKRLMKMLKPDKALPGQPFTVLQSTWKSGVLAMLKCNQQLSASARAEASRNQISNITTCDIDEARQKTLDFISTQAISIIELDSNSLQLWELWIAGVFALDTHESIVSRLSLAIRQLMNTSIDLSRDSRTRNVLGRLITEMPWRESELPKDVVLRTYQENMSNPSELWIYSSMLNRSGKLPWMTSSMVVQPTSNQSEIISMSESLSKNWPVVKRTVKIALNITMPAAFDPELVAQWQNKFERINLNRNELEALIKLRKLNEVAVAIWKGRPGKATQSLTKFDTLKIDSTKSKDVLPSSPDGEWRDEYNNERENAVKLEILEQLLTSDTTDLGTEDADKLASLALVSPKSKLRDTATTIIAQNFPYAKNVAIAIVNHLDKAKSNRQVSALVAKLTDSTLPSLNDPQWKMEARRALVQHALSLHTPNSKDLDVASMELSESLTAEVMLISPSSLPSTSDISAVEGLQLLVNAWKGTLQPMYTPNVSGSFTPTGVLQQYVALQLIYFDLLKAEELRWRGLDPSTFRSIAHDSVFNSSSIVRQMVKLEASVSTHWNQLFNELLDEHEERNK